MTVRVDYAGPGGVCKGLEALGLEATGFELDRYACATRSAAGLATVRCDLTTYQPAAPPGGFSGYWGSPPCQTFSSAGKGGGRSEIDALVATIDAGRWDDASLFDERTQHVIHAARVATTIDAPWVAMEQVRGALPAFTAIARRLRGLGYSTWAGVLNAADYGVPQHRHRAFLLASKHRKATPPEPTHGATETHGLFSDRTQWVSMAEALEFPAGHDTWVVDRRQTQVGANGQREPVAVVPVTKPSPTVTAMTGFQWLIRTGPDTHFKLTREQLLTLQTFPPDHPVQGPWTTSQCTQIGDAVPPALAALLIGQVA